MEVAAIAKVVRLQYVPIGKLDDPPFAVLCWEWAELLLDLEFNHIAITLRKEV
jgi:hypothetical protein